MPPHWRGHYFSGPSDSASHPQTGAWGCFDEFNRINVEVLSVVAQQILSILSALAASLTRFYFEGFEINLVWSCGIFITMNPGTGWGAELGVQGKQLRAAPLPGKHV